MCGCPRLRSAIAVLALATALVAWAGPTAADHRDDGWRWESWHGRDRYGHRHHWHGHHWHRNHWHHDHWHHGHRHRHGSGLSGVFVLDLSPPRRVHVAPPPPVIIRQPPPAAVPAPAQPYCREYTATATIDGRPIPTYGTACRQPDGSWRIVSQNR